MDRKKKELFQKIMIKEHMNLKKRVAGGFEKCDYTVAQLIDEMSLDEKIEYISGINDFCIHPIERLKLNEVWTTDASAGVRGWDEKVTIFPAPIAMAATYNEELIKNISCSENGVYTFTFNGIDDSGNEVSDELILTLPQEGNPIYALCKEQTNTNGSFNVCINYFSAEVTNSNGSAIFFVNHPDVSEYLSNSPICTTNSNGSACFSLGFT